MNKYLTKVAELDDDDYEELERLRYIKNANNYLERKGRVGLIPISDRGEEEAAELEKAKYRAAVRPNASTAAALSALAGVTGGVGGALLGGLAGKAITGRSDGLGVGAGLLLGGLTGGIGGGYLTHSSYYTPARKEEDDRTIEEHKKKLEDLLNKYPLRPELVYSYK